MSTIKHHRAAARGELRCRAHPKQRVTPAGTGCPQCDAERAMSRRERRAARRAERNRAAWLAGQGEM